MIIYYDDDALHIPIIRRLYDVPEGTDILVPYDKPREDQTLLRFVSVDNSGEIGVANCVNERGEPIVLSQYMMVQIVPQKLDEGWVDE